MKHGLGNCIRNLWIDHHHAVVVTLKVIMQSSPLEVSIKVFGGRTQRDQQHRMTHQYHCTGSSEKLRAKLGRRQCKWEGIKKTFREETLTFKLYSWIIRRAGFLIYIHRNSEEEAIVIGQEVTGLNSALPMLCLQALT